MVPPSHAAALSGCVRQSPVHFPPRLRPLDLEFMRRLSKIVNVVPVIAKADTLTLEERAEFKQRVRGLSRTKGDFPRPSNRASSSTSEADQGGVLSVGDVPPGELAM